MGSGGDGSDAGFSLGATHGHVLRDAKVKPSIKKQAVSDKWKCRKRSLLCQRTHHRNERRSSSGSVQKTNNARIAMSKANDKKNKAAKGKSKTTASAYKQAQSKQR